MIRDKPHELYTLNWLVITWKQAKKKRISTFRTVECREFQDILEFSINILVSVEIVMCPPIDPHFFFSGPTETILS